ncbi:MAG: glycosyltransferase [Sulfitobacter sp.]
MQAFSILIQSGNPDQPLPKEAESNFNSFKAHHPDIPHQLFRGPELRAFIKDNFDRDILFAYDKFVPNAYKADLGRYCLLYAMGGIYFDLAMYFHERLPVDPERVTLFRDLFQIATYECYNGLMYVPKGHELLSLAIEACAQNAREEYYGPSPLCPTGPVLFGRNVAIACPVENQNVGEAVMVNIGKPYQSLHFSHPESKNGLVASRRKRGRGLAEVGISGSNVYPALWSSRSVYGFEDVRTYEAHYFAQKKLHTGSFENGKGISISAAQHGLCTRGPNVYLEPGSYVIAAEINVRTVSRLVFDCFAPALGVMDEVVFDDIEDDRNLCILIKVEIETTLDNYQFRLRGPAGKDFDFIAMHIRKV